MPKFKKDAIKDIIAQAFEQDLEQIAVRHGLVDPDEVAERDLKWRADQKVKAQKFLDQWDDLKRDDIHYFRFDRSPVASAEEMSAREVRMAESRRQKRLAYLEARDVSADGYVSLGEAECKRLGV